MCEFLSLRSIEFFEVIVRMKAEKLVRQILIAIIGLYMIKGRLLLLMLMVTSYIMKVDNQSIYMGATMLFVISL